MPCQGEQQQYIKGHSIVLTDQGPAFQKHTCSPAPVSDPDGSRHGRRSWGSAAGPRSAPAFPAAGGPCLPPLVLPPAWQGPRGPGRHRHRRGAVWPSRRHSSLAARATAYWTTWRCRWSASAGALRTVCGAPHVAQAHVVCSAALTASRQLLSIACSFPRIGACCVAAASGVPSKHWRGRGGAHAAGAGWRPRRWYAPLRPTSPRAFGFARPLYLEARPWERHRLRCGHAHCRGAAAAPAARHGLDITAGCVSRSATRRAGVLSGVRCWRTGELRQVCTLGAG